MDKQELHERRRLALIDLKSRPSIQSFRIISDKTGIDPSYLSRCAYPEGKKGKKNIGEDTVLAINKAFPDWIEAEHSVREPEPNNEYTRMGETSQSVTIMQHNDVQGAMGKGVTLPDQNGQITGISVDKEWINNNVPANSGSSNLRIVTGFGDSMKGMFNSGDPLLIDSGINSVDFDGVYFFRVENEGFIKRLQRVPGNGIIVISNNQSYRDWTITEGMDFEVFGRVLKIWNGSEI